MKHLKFSPANQIEFAVRLNQKGQYPIADAIIEAKEFLKKESMKICDLWVEDFYAEIENNTDTIEVLKEYVDFKNKTSKEKINEESFIAQQISKEYIAKLSSIHHVKCIVLGKAQLNPPEVWIELTENCLPYKKNQRYVIEKTKLEEVNEQIQ